MKNPNEMRKTTSALWAFNSRFYDKTDVHEQRYRGQANADQDALAPGGFVVGREVL